MLYRSNIFHVISFSTEPAVEFTKSLEDQTVEEEATATMECEVSRDNAEVRWLREGQEIRKTKKYDMVAEGRIRKLIIRDCTPDDAKMYTCDAKEFKTSAFLSVERKRHIYFITQKHQIAIYYRCNNTHYITFSLINFQHPMLSLPSLFMMLRSKRRKLPDLSVKCHARMPRFV